MNSLIWDQHTCLPLQLDADVNLLTRYRRDGGAFVSVNAGYSPQRFNDTLALFPDDLSGVADALDAAVESTADVLRTVRHLTVVSANGIGG